LHNLTALRFIRETLFVDGFNSTQRLSKLMDGKVHLAESTLTKTFANSVEVDSSLRGFRSFPERQFDQFNQFSDLNTPRS